MSDDDLQRRVERLEGVIDNGRFVRRETYEADMRAQEKVDIAQEQRYASIDDRIDEIRDAITWLQRQIIMLMFSVIGAVVIATLVGSR